MGDGPTLVWFRQDLRLADNPALAAAATAAGAGLIPVFVWAPDDEAPFAPGAASRAWLHASLEALGAALRAHGSRLVLRMGPARQALVALARETGAARVLWNRRYEPAVVARDRQVERALRDAGVEVPPVGSSANLLFQPEDLQTAGGKPFQVFTPFWRACLRSPEPGRPAPALKTLPRPRRWPASLPLDALGLRPTVPWDAGIRAVWTPGEVGARERLSRFVREGLGAYGRTRDRPGLDSSSRLSPHLHFGEVGPRQIWHAAREAAARRRLDAGPFLRELGWREFAYHLLHHFPHTPERPLRPRFERFPWADQPEALRAWQRGETGYPLVDAGMRELWATGFMPNRVRMVTASFLIKHLLCPWQQGARWFWDTLVDADLADNTLGWQWCAGSGADAAPFFRIFNPMVQGQRYDPDGAYVRRWVPELAHLPARYLHAPWTAPADVLALAGVRLGRGYPRPMVDHAWARARALAAFAETVT